MMVSISGKSIKSLAKLLFQIFQRPSVPLNVQAKKANGENKVRATTRTFLKSRTIKAAKIPTNKPKIVTKVAGKVRKPITIAPPTNKVVRPTGEPKAAAQPGLSRCIILLRSILPAPWKGRNRMPLMPSPKWLAKPISQRQISQDSCIAMTAMTSFGSIFLMV